MVEVSANTSFEEVTANPEFYGLCPKTVEVLKILFLNKIENDYISNDEHEDIVASFEIDIGNLEEEIQELKERYED